MTRCDWAWTGGPRCHSLSRLHECELAPHGIEMHHVCYHCGAIHPGAPPPKVDPVNHPPHYTAHASGIECIQVTEHMGFCLGNAVKYLWRADEKGAPVEDLEKAVWYIQREIRRRTTGTERDTGPDPDGGIELTDQEFASFLEAARGTPSTDDGSTP